MTNCLVTGCAGFIGSHVAGECLNLGYSVVGIDNLATGRRDNIPEGVNFVEGSITNNRFLTTLFEESHFDYIYHFAAYASEGHSHFVRNHIYANNVVGSTNLINFAIQHEVECFVFSSSAAIYGEGKTPFTETQCPLPADPYAISKLATELDLMAAHDLFGLNYVILRLHNVFGEKQNFNDQYRNVVAIFLKNALNGNPLPIFGHGEHTRSFTYIGDIAATIAKSPTILGLQNETHNLGASNTLSVAQLADLVLSVTRSDSGTKNLKNRFEVLHAIPSHHKIQTVIGRSPTTSMETALKITYQWLLEHPDALTSYTTSPNTEIRTNLPQGWE